MSNGSVLGLHSVIRAPSLETVLHHGISSSVPSSLPSVMRSESTGNQSGFIDSGHSPSQLKLGLRAAPAIHPHSLPDHPDGLNNNAHCNSLNTIAGNISLRPSERADSRQLCGVNFNGRSIELNEDGKCNDIENLLNYLIKDLHLQCSVELVGSLCKLNGDS